MSEQEYEQEPQEYEQEPQKEIEAIEEEVSVEIEEEPKEAAPNGFMSRDVWEAAGKNPDDWRSEKTFNDFKGLAEANKRLHQQVEHLKTSHDEDMQNLANMHQAQLYKQQQQLESN